MFAIVSVIRKKREGLLGPKGLFFWLSFWILAIFVVLWPDSTFVLSNYFGISRGADLVVYVSLALIFFILFRLHVKLESVGRSLTKMVRKEALEQVKKDKK